MARYKRGSDKVDVFPVQEGYMAAAQDAPNAHTDFNPTGGAVKSSKSI